MMKKVIRDFECAMCGLCCASQDLVRLSTYELYRLADFLKREPMTVFNEHCVITATSLDPARHLYIRTSNGVCPFVKDNKCGVHEARPYACKAYPMRAYWSLAGDMKAFVRAKYPVQGEACSLFKLDDGDVLLGDYELLAKQAIAHWVDDAYFSMAGDRVDLSIPYRVADHYIHDEGVKGVAKRYVVDPEHPPSDHDAELAYAKISLMLQAAMWNATSAFVPIEKQAVHEDERIGKYMLLTADADSVKALRMLVESGRLDLARTLAITSKVRDGGHIVAAIHGSSSDHVALGFLFEADKGTLEELADNGNKPLYVFFTADGAPDGKLAGFQLNIKI
jgi:Fe-S-cluster containining protein